MAPATAPPLPAAPASALRAAFPETRGYLAACTAGILPLTSRAALLADLDRRPDPVAYSAVVERTRTAFAALASVAPENVAIGSQVSVQASLVATALDDGAEILCAEGDFSSIVLPFVHAGRALTVRTAPLAALADAVGPRTALVAFSLVQSSTGEVADVTAVVAAAARHGALTFCDATQAAGWMPVDAGAFDALVCHAYKWLCAPRGVSFLALSDRLQERMRPLQAGWYAGDDPWSSCYGGSAVLAPDARRFDVSPAWQAFVGAEPALALFAAADLSSVHARTTKLAADLRARLGLPSLERSSSIVTWSDPDGCDLARLTAAGVAASGRAGRARVAFHVFNDEDDVELVVRGLGR